MKTTTTLFEIIKSELLREGYNEFVNNQHLTFFDHNFAIIRKIIKFDSDVESIVNDLFFVDEQLDIYENDVSFKKQFVNRFYNREIGFQTLETFSSQLIYVFMSNKDYLNHIYNLDDFITSKSISTNESTGNTESDDRNLTSTLPQNEVNLNVDDTELDYGDTNTISKNRTKQSNDSATTGNDFNIDNVLKMKGLLAEIFDEFDRKCFLQVW